MSKTVAIIGHVAKDVKEGSKDEDFASWEYVPGGGVFYGAIALARVLVGSGINVIAVTKGRKEDKAMFEKPFEEAGIKNLHWIPSETTTTFRNIYIDNDPTKRVSRVLERASPFTVDDIKDIKADWTIISPLWAGEFPEDLIEYAAKEKKLGHLIADIQGFNRLINEDGCVHHVAWEKIDKYAPMLYLLKADDRETLLQVGGPDEWETGAKALSRVGCKIICTCAKGVLLAEDGKVEKTAMFGHYEVSGRTGRGDTVTASFVASLALGATLAQALDNACKVTTFKMQTPGPLRELPTDYLK